MALLFLSRYSVELVKLSLNCNKDEDIPSKDSPPSAMFPTPLEGRQFGLSYTSDNSTKLSRQVRPHDQSPGPWIRANIRAASLTSLGRAVHRVLRRVSFRHEGSARVCAGHFAKSEQVFDTFVCKKKLPILFEV